MNSQTEHGAQLARVALVGRQRLEPVGGEHNAIARSREHGLGDRAQAVLVIDHQHEISCAHRPKYSFNCRRSSAAARGSTTSSTASS